MMGDGILDPTALRHLLEITGGDESFLDELLDTFLEDAEDQLAALRAAVASGSTEALVRPAHSLKSNAANVGASDLAELCRGLEADARGGTVEDATARVAAIESAFAAVRQALAARPKS